jgi:hypothetical protein
VMQSSPKKNQKKCCQKNMETPKILRSHGSTFTSSYNIMVRREVHIFLP